MNSLPVGQNDCLKQAEVWKNRADKTEAVIIGTLIEGSVASLISVFVGVFFATESVAIMGSALCIVGLTMVMVGENEVHSYFAYKADYLREKGEAQEKQQLAEQSSVEEEELPLSTLLAPKPNGPDVVTQAQFDSILGQRFIHS